MDLDPKVLEVVQRPSRLRALAALEANAESSADALDRITRIACRTLDVPVALVNLIGAEKQVFLGCGPLPEPWSSMREMPVTAGWCPFALGARDAYAFADAREETSLADNPAAARLGVVAYAGVPLRTSDGEPVGTLCALDYKPHDWTDDELELLTDLATGALHELQLLAASRVATREHERLHHVELLSTQLVAADTAGKVLDAVIGAVERTNAGVLWRVADDGTLGTAASTGARAAPIASGDPVRLDAPLAHAQVARAGEPRFLESRSAVREGFDLEDLQDIGSVVLLPVAAAGRPLGVLGTFFADERTFSEDDREYFAALGGLSSLAVARA